MGLLQVSLTLISPGCQAQLHSFQQTNQEAYCQDSIDSQYCVIMMRVTLLFLYIDNPNEMKIKVLTKIFPSYLQGQL